MNSFNILLQYDDLQVRLAAPYQLQVKPDASDLGFGKYFTDHMLKINYQKQLGGWQKPEITPFENLSIHPAAKALHYAIQVSSKTFNKIRKHNKIFVVPTVFIFFIARVSDARLLSMCANVGRE